MLWVFIFLAVLAAAGAAFAFLTSRFYRLSAIKALAKGSKKRRLALSLLSVALLFAVAWLTMGSMNALVCMLHLVLFWLLCELLFRCVRQLRERKSRHNAAAALAFAVTAVYLSVGWVLANRIWRTEYAVETDKAAGSLRIVHFADSHVGTTFDGEGFARYVDEMQALAPDVVLITGDYVDDDTSKADMVAACAALGRLQTTYGVYFSFGNHDKGYFDNARRGYDGDDLIAELNKNGVTVLQDESVLLDDRFYIVGRQDASEESRGMPRAPIGELVRGLDCDKYIIVMDHQPGDYENEAAAGVDLVLSGHTHGGQLIPITYVGEWIGENDRTYGMEERGSTRFIVTSGISDWALWFKTGCKSEYVVIDVKGK